MRFAQPAKGLSDDKKREPEKQARLDQRGERLIFSMAVVMFGVGRLFGLAHREICQHCRPRVDAGVTGLG